MQGGRGRGRGVPTLESDARKRLAAVEVPFLAAGVTPREGDRVGRTVETSGRLRLGVDSARLAESRRPSSRSRIACTGVLPVGSVVTSGRPFRATRSFSQVICGAGTQSRSYSERERKGHERAAVAVHPITCQPADSIPRRSEKAMAGVLNQYGTRFVGRALWSPNQRDERRPASTVT